MTSKISEWPLHIRGDDRGSLVALESLRDVPFAIARVYYIFTTKAGVAPFIRTNHRNNVDEHAKIPCCLALTAAVPMITALCRPAYLLA